MGVGNVGPLDDDPVRPGEVPDGLEPEGSPWAPPLPDPNAPPAPETPETLASTQPPWQAPPPSADPEYGGPAQSKRSKWFWIAIGLACIIGLVAVGIGAIIGGSALISSAVAENVPRDSDLFLCYGKDGSKQAVPCDERHYFEVYSAAEFWPDEPYPSAVDRSLGLDVCEEDFELHTGDGFWSSVYTYSVLYPTEADWKAGDRVVLCVLHHTELRPAPDFG